MSTSAKAIRVDELMQKAMQSLKAAKWFDAEQLAVRALQFAHGDADFERMALIVPALQEARRQRFQLALDAAKKTVKVLDGELGEEPVLAPGAYLLQPPLVGADARRARLASLARNNAVAILCREPTNAMGLVPIVAIGGVTVRTRIKGWGKAAKVDFQWFVEAIEQLGDSAIESLDTGQDPDRQVDDLMNVLDSVPEHEKLHQTLVACCKLAAKSMRDRPATLPDLDESVDE
jgi:hypothetical protein